MLRSSTPSRDSPARATKLSALPPQTPENPPDPKPPPETNPPPQATNIQPIQPPNESRYDDEVCVIHHQQPDYSCRDAYGNRYGPRYSRSSGEPWGSHPGPSYRHQPPHQPVYHEQTTSIVYRGPLDPPEYRKPPPQPVYHEHLTQFTTTASTLSDSQLQLTTHTGHHLISRNTNMYNHHAIQNLRQNGPLLHGFISECQH
ncbi:LOW QUALITY PROTEIN: hypothetical protein Cgig2_029204 [Carnegiea gigantea]|uniref:Uncharacterized protein n=1 Tax=Carnegiea gigantea TaxID=171969 RepID=A0A9Q1KK33_9CARY|nr:LOW QUALITY PROTEIN: hypothetical protein Cgig2_029204 [Carnegiea gigantea]